MDRPLASLMIPYSQRVKFWRKTMALSCYKTTLFLVPFQPDRESIPCFDKTDLSQIQ